MILFDLPKLCCTNNYCQLTADWRIMEYYLLLKWLLQMVNVKSYGLPDCAWSNVWIHCEPWQITYIVKNPYFFMQPELETYPFSYVLHETTTTMDSNSIRVFFCCYSVTAEKFNLLMSYMHFNNRNLSIIIHLITTPLHMCTECGNEWRVPQSMAAHKLLFCCFAKR